MQEQEEIWKDIPGYEGYYQASNLGNIKSLRRAKTRFGKFHSFIEEKILRKHTGTGGYDTVSLYKDNKGKTLRIHQLVASAFLNHTPNRHDIVVNHVNHVRSDNRLCNLELISQRENTSKKAVKYSSKYVGVSSYGSGRWLACINIGGRSIHLGVFDLEIDAAKAYQRKLSEIK